MGFDSGDIDEALRRLGQANPFGHDVIRLRIFGECTLKETSKALQASVSTVKREYINAMAILLSYLG